MLIGSNMILQFGDMFNRSPLANVNVLLSSSTEFKFSIQMLSTGPSSTSQTYSPINDNNERRLPHASTLEEVVVDVEVISEI